MRKTSLLIIFLIIFIDLLGFGIVIPLLPFYAREFSASGKVIGATVAVYSLMQFIFSPIWGRVSDRVGRRPVLLISLTGSVLGYATFAVAHTQPFRSRPATTPLHGLTPSRGHAPATWVQLSPVVSVS